MARRARDLTVGAMFALALVVLALAIMAVGGESGILFSRTSYFAVFAGADGLLVGAPVKMNGVQIGTITNIRLPTDPAQPGIKVDFGIDPSYAERVREDSRAALRILQLLTNEKFVEILPGSLDSPPLAAGAEVQPLIEEGLFERGEAVADSLGEITVSLKNILGPLERGEGLIGKMIQDPEFAREGAAAFGGALADLHAITSDLRAGKGAVGRLLSDDELAGRLDRLGAVIDDFAAVMETVSRGDGALGKLLEEGGDAELAIADLRETTASLKRIVQRFEQDTGLLGRLINDPEYSEQLAADLSNALDNLVEITEKVNEGEGSIAALLNDRQLYDGAEEVVAGVNDSKFARWLLRHYRKKGIKAEEKRASDPQDASADAPPDP